MTESEWAACRDPKPMLAFATGKVSDRKLRLFGAACCRRIWHLLPSRSCQTAVEVAERFADGEATRAELRLAGKAAFATWNRWDERIQRINLSPHRIEGILRNASINMTASDASSAAASLTQVGENFYVPHIARDASLAAADQVEYDPDAYGHPEAVAANHPFIQARQLEEYVQCKLLREIIGNPFQLPSVPRPCLPTRLKSKARRIYDKRSFHCLPDFADQLQETGYEDADILRHCRQSDCHVVGCWALDHLLDRE